MVQLDQSQRRQDLGGHRMVMTLEQENSARYHDLHNTTIFTHYKKFDWAMKN